MSDQMQTIYVFMVGGFAVSSWLIMLILLDSDSYFYKIFAPPFLCGGIAWLALAGIGLPPFSDQFADRANVLSAMANSFVALYMIGATLYAALFYFGFWPGRGNGSGDSHRRGGRVVATKDLIKLANREVGHARIGEVQIPARVEPYHFLLAGATGAGKTQAFLQLTESARQRKHCAVLADCGAEVARRYYDPANGDIILNPLDQRGADWSPLAEMRGEWDADSLAKSIIPDRDGDNEWQHYSQTLLAAVLQRLFESGHGTNSEIVRLLTVASNHELLSIVQGLPAQALFDEGASRMLASIKAIVATYIKPLSWCNPDAGEKAFSIRRHVEEERPGWIFLTVRDDQLKSLRPLIAAQIDVAISALLSLPPSDVRRLWFFLDEFATFGRIQGIEGLLTKARKCGGIGVLGMQSIAQLQEKDAYGLQKSQTLLSCLGTWLTLRAQDAATAEYMSKYIGDEEVRRVMVNTGTSDAGKSTTHQEQISTQRAIMPADLQGLADRVGILNIVGAIPAGWVTIPVSQRRPSMDAFVERQRRGFTVN